MEEQILILLILGTKLAFLKYIRGRRGGLMLSAVDSRLSGQRFEPWLGTLCCVLGQVTLLSRCLSPPRCINGYWRIVGETYKNCRGVTCDGLASRPRGSS